MTKHRNPTDLRAAMLRQLSDGPIPLSEMCGRMSYWGSQAYDIADQMVKDGSIIVFDSSGKSNFRTRTVKYAALPGAEIPEYRPAGKRRGSGVIAPAPLYPQLAGWGRER